MPNDKSPPKLETVAKHETGGDCVSRLVRFSVTSCEDCPFHAQKYCGLSQKLNEKYGTDYPTFVANEWKQGVSPARCPLKKADILFTSENSADINHTIMKPNTAPTGDSIMRLAIDFDFDFERSEELNDLMQLIHIAGSLNKGSGIVEKIKTMESIADRLTRNDMAKPRQSFMHWLGDVAFNFLSANAKNTHT